MRSVLIIDDEQMVRDLLKKAMNLVGFDVETADSAAQGIARFDSKIFDLVITDVRMPGVDGRGVLQHIRNSERYSTPVIGVSGTPWLLQEGQFDDVLHKPFAIQALIEKVTTLTCMPVFQQGDRVRMASATRI